MTQSRAERIMRSAEWAAYGDALGFITELADSDRVQHRLGAERVVGTVAWKRKVGGYNGAVVEFPPGTYSDDTQLRLATSRAIRADGTFDVAAFAKVELPAWVNYALGAGTGSKEAATNLARTSATWYSNFFDGKRASYMQGGGNGAAMRIQPHVWSARNLKDDRAILVDVVRNAVCTHGHARGIIGACLHASMLAYTLREQKAPDFEALVELTSKLDSLPKIIESDGDLRLFWLGLWEKASGSSFAARTKETIAEILEDIERLRSLEGRGGLENDYDRALDAIGARDAAVRGSGTKTALLAGFVALHVTGQGPHGSLLAVANSLGSDTDSIATMAGAIIGACSEFDCEGTIQDRDYIRAEARRLADVAAGIQTVTFRYPDIRSWKPPRAAIDAVGLVDDRLWLNGLGELRPINGQRVKTGDEVLVWCQLSFGQTILARVRTSPNKLSPSQARATDEGVTRQRDANPPSRLRDLFGDQEVNDPRGRSQSGKIDAGTLDEILQLIISEGFPPDLIGEAILHQADGRSDFVERGIALTATLLTAYEARIRRSRKR